MEILLFVILISIVIAWLSQSTPQIRVIYVPVEVIEPTRNLGCLPLIVLGVLIFVLFAVLGSNL